VDALGGLLDGVRARGAFVLRLSLDPPWSMRIQDDAPLTLICMTRGDAVIVTDAGEEFALHAGDVALARGTEHYVFGVRTWGNAAEGAHRGVVCAYEGHSEVSSRLLKALPTVLVLRADEWRTPLVDVLNTEAAQDGPGQEAYLDRLLDLLLIDVLRAWFDRADNAPTWWHAEHDPVVGRALKLIYHNPGHPWTVANLASAVGCSRALFARRFTERVGEPPIAFLTSWRLALAADMLRSTATTIAAIAREVGYGTPFALSSAFKRAYGVSPNSYRRDAAYGEGSAVSAL